MPARSKALGFICICGRDYGSIQFLRGKNNGEIKRQIPISKNDLDVRHIPKRSTLYPVEYSLRNVIITHYEEKMLDRVTKNLAALRRESWRLLPFSPPMVVSERQKLEEFEAKLKARVEKKRQQRLSEEDGTPEDSNWNVIENLEDMDRRVYELTKRLGGDFVSENVNINEVEMEGVVGSTCVIRWNPKKIIMKYRRSGDPFRHFYFDMDFYAKALAKYHCTLEGLSEENKDILGKGFDVINRYRKQFANRNYRYTYFEWFWIVRYAQVCTPRRAAKMLLALDGKEGKISPKHIKDNMQATLMFWNDFTHYAGYFFLYLKFIRNNIIERDPELKQEFNNILVRNQKENENYVINNIFEKHFDGLVETTIDNDGNKINYYEGNADDFKAVRLRQPRVRIYHSNPNYQKEMEEFENNIRNMKPKKKISCTFSPCRLPRDVRIELHKEGKVPIIESG